jgi:4a-hydroxytetrahydrobiopterin dehydratase
MSELAQKHCVPCHGGIPPLRGEEITRLKEQLSGWLVVDEHHLTKTYAFEDFASALAFVNEVGAVAEDQGHHPDVFLAWGRVRLEIFTHKVDGLTESDFILAAKADEIDT